MSLVNKSFKNNQTGEVVRIIDSYQNIAITENKERIDANRLMDNRYYTEYIDPKSFFQNESTYSVFAEKIKNVDLSKVPIDKDISPINGDVLNLPTDNVFSPATNESAVVMYDPEDEKAELMRKYGATDTGALNKQNQAFAKLLGEDDDGEVIKVDADRPQPQTQSQPVVQPQTEVVQRVNFEDPIITMLKMPKEMLIFQSL